MLFDAGPSMCGIDTSANLSLYFLLKLQRLELKLKKLFWRLASLLVMPGACCPHFC